MLILITERLFLYLTKICRFMVFQLYYSNDLSIQQYSPIGFLGICFIFLFCYQVIVWRGVKRIT